MFAIYLACNDRKMHRVSMYVCNKKYIGTQCEFCRQLKIFLPPPPSPAPVVYSTDRSKAVVPVLFLFCVALRFILRGASCYKVFLCSFFIPFSIVITSLGEEGAGLCASRALVCFVRFSFCHFSLPPGVGG